MIRSYGLPEVAEMYLPPEWTDSVRWLQRRLRRKEISGYKVGQSWRMTEADVEAMIARYRNIPTAAESTPRSLSFTSRSQRRQAS